MQMILMRDGVWENVTLPKPDAEKLPADWEQREHKAMAAIGLAVEDNQLVHLTVDYIRGKLIQNILQNLPPPCHYSTVHPQVAAGGTASKMQGNCEHIE